MSSLDDLLTTSTIAGNGDWDETYPFIEKKIVLDPNTIIVREGTEVKWSVEKEGYLPKSGELIAKDFHHDITVILKKYVTFTIEVTFTAIGGDSSLPEILLTGESGINLTETKLSPKSTETIIVAQRSIDVPEGNYVSYVVSKNGFNTKKGNYRVNATTTLPITLNDNAYTFTVNPTPHDADVLIVAERPLSQQIGNSILVEGKPNSSSGSTTSTITYTVSKEGFETISNTLPYITSDTSIDVTIKQFFSVQITVTDPADAEIKITNIIGAKPWEPQKYYDVHALVTYENKFYNCTRNHTSSMSFEPEYWTEVQTSAWVIDGYTVQYEIKRVGYREIKSSILVKKDENISIRMESTGGFCPEWTDTDLFCLENNTSVAFQSEASTDANLQKYIFRVIPTPNDSTVILQWNGVTYYQNTLENVVDGDNVSYTVSKEHYVEKSKSLFITNNTDENVTINLEQYQLTINSDPEENINVDFNVSGFTKVGNSIIVDYGTVVPYTVTSTHYETITGTKTVTEDVNITVPLTRKKYTITVNTEPAENTKLIVSAPGYETITSNNGTATITVDSETIISWSTQHDGYYSGSGSFKAEKSEIKLIPLSNAPSYTFTINPLPVDASVTFRYNGTTYNTNSVVIPYGGIVEWSVSKNDFISQSGTKEMINDATENVVLSYVSETLVFESEEAITNSPIYIPTNGIYKVELVGGGAGGHGHNDRLQAWESGGGSGAYLCFKKYITAGNYNISVGKGGHAGTAGKKGDNYGGGAGGESSAFGQTAGGGLWVNGGGTGGSITTSGDITIVEQVPGKNGGYHHNGYAWNIVSNGGASAYDNTLTGYGAGGKAECHGGKWTDHPGITGYIKITAV